MKYNKTVNRNLKFAAAALLCSSLALAPVFTNFRSFVQASTGETENYLIKKVDSGKIDASLENYFDDSVVYRLSDKVSSEQEISVIVSMSTDSVLDAYKARSGADKSLTVAEYAISSAGKRTQAKIQSEAASLQNLLRKGDFNYAIGEEYNVILSGFEVTVKAKDFKRLSKLIGDKAELIVGDEYEKCESQVVENVVDVDESTGIFNSKGSKYDGSGTVVAVLDTGLDYTHSAFDVSRFTGDEVLTLDKISERIANSAAAGFSAGLTANDVYINKKVPFGYDYADKDSDVYPFSSEHGTHVSGVMVGNDDTIRGVAPNAQLVSMKVFSDLTEGAKDSWILSALEDCVLLGVDVINMSLGTSCGFSNQQDKKQAEAIYDSIREAGISLVAAASNDYSSSMSSEKNGNLGLTSNPDTATVGSPSTYPASLSVASVSGTKTPYLIYDNRIVYFTEASDQASNPKEFVNEILKGTGKTTETFDYVTVPGIGLSTDYNEVDVKGKIVLVKRGNTTFEDKVRVASRKGAAGIIIYNNVSGKISMTVGRVNLPACSISQDDGELLAVQKEGKITISTSQTAGPFMSDFSSWGPTPDLKIKPEITAHGGNIVSAVPGQKYDKMSGTSMASPNQAGVTALVRQYVKETFPALGTTEVTARVNQLMMSTADIVYGPNGLPYAVRKQGSGLANLAAATATPAYVATYDAGGEMDKAKIELGDDAKKTGVYTLEFFVNNVSGKSLTYEVGGIVMTEGVSKTLTVRGDQTVTEEGYLLGAAVEVKGVTGGTNTGNSVTVSAGGSARVTVRITLTDSDKEYLNTNFKNGMFVEGFITLKGTGDNNINLNVPYLAFYGDWNQAPIFDLDFYETNPDELNKAIDDDKKTMADGYATRPIGGLYEDYISYLGSYYFIQDPSATPIAANREHISLTNQTGEDGGVNSISSLWAGMLRGADRVDMTIADAVTGEVIFTNTEYNQRKSYARGGNILMSPIDVDFELANYNLKNNTRYDVKFIAYTAYGDGGLGVNGRNTFEFTFTTDFEAPLVTSCDYYTEYDATAKKTRLFANIGIYDNHFSQAASIGVINENETENTPRRLVSFDRYLTPLYSSFNSTYTLTYELTDYIGDIKNSYNGNSFFVQLMDYAMNISTFEITVPDNVTGIQSFLDNADKPVDSLTVSPNEVYAIKLNVVSPDNSWAETVTFTSSDESVAGVVNGKIIARKPGKATITAISNSNLNVTKTLELTVLSEGEEGYVKYDKPVTDAFKLTNYYVEKAYYFVVSEDRDLGEQGNLVQFTGTNYALEFFPSESITVHYDLKAYFPDDVSVVFESSNSEIVEVDEKGTITAVAEGSASISIRVLMDGKSTYYSQTISITVKKPYETNGPWLMKYTGLGGEVVIPAELGVTEIYNYAFSNYKYIPKDENDEISEEDPYKSKIWPIGENTITKVVIPEGVKVIDSYAFAYLTALEEVALPSTLNKIQNCAFKGCTKLKKINLENVQFINNEAFLNCPIESVRLNSLVAIGNSAFAIEDECKNFDGKPVHSVLESVVLPASAQSLGSYAFCNNIALKEVIFNASSVKLGSYVFANCSELTTVSVNAAVIPSSSFDNCKKLSTVTLGKDVSIIGQFAFAGTSVRGFNVSAENATLKASLDGSFILNKDGTTVILAAPLVRSFNPPAAEKNAITKIGEGAFSGNSTVTSVTLPNVTDVGDYAFAGCTSLNILLLGELTHVGDYAFTSCVKLSAIPALSSDLSEIGAYAFAGCMGLTGVEIADNTVLGEGAFMGCDSLETLVIGNNVKIGDGAFFSEETSELSYMSQQGHYLAYFEYGSASKLTRIVIGNNAQIGAHAFRGQANVTEVELGEKADIGEYAFYGNISLASIDLSKATNIDAYAFAGVITEMYWGDIENGQLVIIQSAGFFYESPMFTNVEILSAESIGEGAFMFNERLEKVVLGDSVKEIGEGAFIANESLAEINLGKVEFVGDLAFGRCTSLKTVDLGSAWYVGSGAFTLDAGLEEAILGNGVIIGNEAFSGCTALTAVNVSGAEYIGKSAFAGTAVTNADLTSVVILDDYAFEFSKVETVVFGTKLKTLGENPFAGCAVSRFINSVGSKNFEISDKVFVEDGVLYAVAPNGGYVLVSYPAGKTDTDYSVKTGTVRIAGAAFAFNENLITVELPYELGAIGDKAFYGCDSLTVVVFKSLSAPILEEEYDVNYQEYNNLPLTGCLWHIDEIELDEATIKELQLIYGDRWKEGWREEVDSYKGMGLLPFLMWTAEPSNYLYGANFIDYVGKQNKPLVFVTPSNGEYYGAFIISQYYTKNVAGAVAPVKATLAAIAAINGLSEYISLADEDAVIAARAAYDAIPTLEQKALVTNYEKLTSAEDTIEFLKDKPIVDDPSVIVIIENHLALVITFSVLTGVFFAATVTLAVLWILDRKKIKKNKEN